MWEQAGVSYNIQYYSNGGSSVVATTGNAMPNTEIALSNTIPNKSSYIFRAWCSVSNAKDIGKCSGDIYISGDPYKITGPTNITLYAMYLPQCNTTGVRLRDGKCWSATDATSAKYEWADASAQCKTPWHLPSHNEYYNLLRAYFSAVSWSDSVRGYLYEGNALPLYADFGLKSESGRWWTSTEYDTSTMGTAYNLYLTRKVATTVSTNQYKHQRWGIRCISN